MQSVAPGARTLILQLLATSFMTGPFLLYI